MNLKSRILYRVIQYGLFAEITIILWALIQGLILDSSLFFYNALYGSFIVATIELLSIIATGYYRNDPDRIFRRRIVMMLVAQSILALSIGSFLKYILSDLKFPMMG